MEELRQLAKMRMEEFEKWFNFLPLRAFLYRLLGFVPPDVSKCFEFGEMGVIQLYVVPLSVVRSDFSVIDRLLFLRLIKSEQQPATASM
ncbi:hypothetical protein [Halobacterium sp. R2-5]|uniref:hypothetical protein n=1 Tax=Halobacterium sp. R2-5 TaxID=2715751 RepID=UPI001421C02F|nr:hypothetical protein [Halobacterium sp. R2-5]NIC00988.1 hypothetical protein [Halobacterium sp. R2-5]